MSKLNEKIDALVLDVVTAEWTKTALVISKVFDTPNFSDLGVEAQDIAERIYILADNGRLDVQGNMRRWRDSAVKLIG